MSTFFQWLHVAAAVVGIGGVGFLLLVLLPSAQRLAPEQRHLLMRLVSARFRWVSWSVILVLIGSGLFSIRQYYWDVAWGTAWKFLTVKIILAFFVFAISLSLTLPFKAFDKFRSRRKMWLAIAFATAMVVILLSSYLRRG